MATHDPQQLLSKFPFGVPAGYRWLIERGLAGFEPNSALQPWYLLPHDELFCVNERWPRAEDSDRLHAFARRQDCDDLACFAVAENASQIGVFVVHGWTSEGYEVVKRFGSIWEWLTNVVHDIEEWVALAEE
jgi:hypothetical protein